jgi:hypothetical protein
MADDVDVAELEAWAAGPQEIHARIAPRFARSEPRERVAAYVRGLLALLERKNGWTLAEQAGESSPDGMPGGGQGAGKGPPRAVLARRARSGASAPTAWATCSMRLRSRNRKLVALLKANSSSYTWVAATVGASNAAGYQLSTGNAVMAIGG